MHRHIKVVAILLIVQGGLEAIMGILLCIMGPVMMTVMQSAPPPSGGGSAPPPELFGAIYIGMGVISLIASIIKIIAGVRNVSFKSRTLGFIGLGSCLLSIASCYCMPTALGVGIYGLIVYVNERAAEAFRLAETGMPTDQVLATIDGTMMGPPGPYPPQPYPPQYPPYPPQ